MQVSSLIKKWPLAVSNNLTWTSHNPQPYRVWVISPNDSPKAVGIMASCLNELKEKALKLLVIEEENAQEISLEKISIFILENRTFIIDDDYLRSLSSSDELVLLLPGQTWSSSDLFMSETLIKDDYSVNRSLVQRKSSSKTNEKSDFRYFVPTPEGEVARFTVDVFRQHPTDAGCVRLTAATAGEASVAVTYELKFNGIRNVVHFLLKSTAVMMVHAGNLLATGGELLKRYTS